MKGNSRDFTLELDVFLRGVEAVMTLPVAVAILDKSNLK